MNVCHLCFTSLLINASVTRPYFPCNNEKWIVTTWYCLCKLLSVTAPEKSHYRLNPRVCKIRQPLDTKVFEKADIFWCFHGVEIAKITNQACKIRYLGVIELSTFIFISIISLKCKLIHKATEFDLHFRENSLHKASFHEDRNVQQIVEKPCFNLTHLLVHLSLIIMSCHDRSIHL